MKTFLASEFKDRILRPYYLEACNFSTQHTSAMCEYGKQAFEAVNSYILSKDQEEFQHIMSGMYMEAVFYSLISPADILPDNKGLSLVREYKIGGSIIDRLKHFSDWLYAKSIDTEEYNHDQFSAYYIGFNEKLQQSGVFDSTYDTQDKSIFDHEPETSLLEDVENMKNLADEFMKDADKFVEEQRAK